MEAQIQDLEAEVRGLSHSLDGQKSRMADVESASQKRIDDLTKDLSKKVHLFLRNKRLMFLMVYLQSSENEQLKTKLKNLGDYDEIKRELEIMKVENWLYNQLCAVSQSELVR